MSDCQRRYGWTDAEVARWAEMHEDCGDEMLSRSFKAAFYKVFHVPMRANAVRHRLLPKRRETCKVHLGPGQRNYLDGWVNVDTNFMTAKIDIWADISAKLPFRDGTVDAFYSHHVIEHIVDSQLPAHFADMYRCLKPGGSIRIAGPNGDEAIRKFVEKDLEWFGDFPDRRTSLGGRFANFLLCRGEHFTILTASYMTELAEGAGFSDFAFCKPSTETRSPAVFDSEVLDHEWDSTPDSPHTIVMEARKPLA